MRVNYAKALYQDPGATLDDVREAVTTLEDTAPNARRVLGGAHPSGGSRSACERREPRCRRDGGVSAIRDAVCSTTSGERKTQDQLCRLKHSNSNPRLANSFLGPQHFPPNVGPDAVGAPGNTTCCQGNLPRAA